MKLFAFVTLFGEKGGAVGASVGGLRCLDSSRNVIVIHSFDRFWLSDG